MSQFLRPKKSGWPLAGGLVALCVFALVLCWAHCAVRAMPMAQEPAAVEAPPVVAPVSTAAAAMPSPPGVPPIKPVPLETKTDQAHGGESELLSPPGTDLSAPQPIENAAQLPTDPPSAQDAHQFSLPGGLGGPEQWTSPEGISSALQTLALLTVVSLAPAVLMMTTCFVRIAIVLGLLRQALGTQQLPSNQVVTSLALFMSLLIMAPVWNQVYEDAVVPYAAHEISLHQAWDTGIKPVRGFMSAQIERTGNSGDVWLFYKYLPADTPAPSSYNDVPLTVLMPAFMLSELKTAFLIGFQVFLPFLVIDLVVSSVTISMGMFMVPPVLVSLPMKLLLFVLVDGWHLVVGMLMDSFQLVA